MPELIRAGRLPYADAWELQKRLVAARIAEEIPDTIIVCEHDAVYTLGRRKESRNNLLDPGDTPVFEVERGGDVTWHGPGQVVAYPIVRLEPLDLHRHLRTLEQVMIDVLAEIGVEAGRDPQNAGVWITQGNPGFARKVGSVGVACRQQVTWHGLALNVDPDLSGFQRVNPCGLDANLLSSLRALGVMVSRDEVEERLVTRLASW